MGTFRLLNARYAILAMLWLRLTGRFVSPDALARWTHAVGRKLKVVYREGDGPWQPAGVEIDAKADGRRVTVTYRFIAPEQNRPCVPPAISGLDVDPKALVSTLGHLNALSKINLS